MQNWQNQHLETHKSHLAIVIIECWNNPMITAQDDMIQFNLPRNFCISLMELFCFQDIGLVKLTPQDIGNIIQRLVICVQRMLWQGIWIKNIDLDQVWLLVRDHHRFGKDENPKDYEIVITNCATVEECGSMFKALADLVYKICKTYGIQTDAQEICNIIYNGNQDLIEQEIVKFTDTVIKEVQDRNYQKANTRGIESKLFKILTFQPLGVSQLDQLFYSREITNRIKSFTELMKQTDLHPQELLEYVQIAVNDSNDKLAAYRNIFQGSQTLFNRFYNQVITQLDANIAQFSSFGVYQEQNGLQRELNEQYQYIIAVSSIENTLSQNQQMDLFQSYIMPKLMADHKRWFNQSLNQLVEEIIQVK